ncbi:hypothetical protein [Mycobacterium sherrisii]|uniref:hypothetical protein n=1 Tax=Mycobacterium sherrisii TaxID=243061 RepID=UPI0011544940|nr:hypothetical protein [Mycobacterium sherrisii]MCV7032495.1 hypothetical protein [Mycobacterium sherrisii]
MHDNDNDNEVRPIEAMDPDSTAVADTPPSGDGEPDPAVPADPADGGLNDKEDGSPKAGRRGRVSRSSILVYGVLPAAALVLTLVAGYMKWQIQSYNYSQTAAVQATSAAMESTIAMLSYQPNSVGKDLKAASNRLTGSFRDEYTKLINEVVIPGAQQKRIAAVATVPVAAPVSADARHVIVLAYVNQTTTIGNTSPTDTASSVRLTMEKVDNRWLIANFEPV